MKIINIIWTIIVNLVELLIVFAVFSATGTAFEKIICALLILIYETVVWNSMVLGKTNTAFFLTVHKHLLQINKATSKETESEEGEIKEVEEKLAGANTTFWIKSVFVILITLTSFLFLISSL